MSIPDFQFDPPTGHNNTEVFPEYPARDQVRPLFQRLFDQIRDFINTSVKGTVNTHLADLAKYAVFTKTNNQPLNNLTQTQIIWEQKQSFNDEDFCRIDISGSGRVEILQNGIYEVSVTVEFSSNSNGMRSVVLQGGTISSVQAFPSYKLYTSVSTFLQLSAGSLIQCSATQSSGDILNILPSLTSLRIRRIVKL